ncbi:hypothetical protein Salat_1885500 [Sesamum alatum]|uniref:Uncharacterized protein n=1 Tax=Sesamum alatum TaxID=300844 RepID=A0AAE1Y4B4_9LAMI|nr:hypothetical protein Salat_1885500 [Sesamum alatum]
MAKFSRDWSPTFSCMIALLAWDSHGLLQITGNRFEGCLANPCEICASHSTTFRSTDIQMGAWHIVVAYFIKVLGEGANIDVLWTRTLQRWHLITHSLGGMVWGRARTKSPDRDHTLSAKWMSSSAGARSKRGTAIFREFESPGRERSSSNQNKEVMDDEGDSVLVPTSEQEHPSGLEGTPQDQHLMSLAPEPLRLGETADTHMGVLALVPSDVALITVPLRFTASGIHDRQGS